MWISPEHYLNCWRNWPWTMVIMEEFALHLFSGIPNHTEVANISCCTVFATMFIASFSLYKKYWERLHYECSLIFLSHHSYRKFHSKIQKRPFSPLRFSDQIWPLNLIYTPGFTVQLSIYNYSIIYICQCMKRPSQCYCHFKELFIYWLIDWRWNSQTFKDLSWIIHFSDCQGLENGRPFSPTFSVGNLL